MKKLLLSLATAFLCTTALNAEPVNQADFSTMNGGKANTNSYTSYTSTNGWSGTNICLQQDATKTEGNLAPTMNGKTSAVGKITSPTLNGGIGKLSFKCVNTFNESNGISIKVEIKQKGEVVKTENCTFSSTEAGSNAICTYTSSNLNVEGDFVIVLTNNCPSHNSNSNKDRVSVYNLTWTNYEAADLTVKPDAPVFSYNGVTLTEADLEAYYGDEITVTSKNATSIVDDELTEHEGDSYTFTADASATYSFYGKNAQGDSDVAELNVSLKAPEITLTVPGYETVENNGHYVVSNLTGVKYEVKGAKTVVAALDNVDVEAEFNVEGYGLHNLNILASAGEKESDSSLDVELFVAAAQAGKAEGYSLVKNVAELADAEALFVIAGKAGNNYYAMSQATSSNKISSVSANVEGETLTCTAENLAEFKAVADDDENTENTYAFYCEGKGYLTKGSGNTDTKYADESESTAYAVSIDASTYAATIYVSSERYIRLYANSHDFRAYTSTSNGLDVSLYKKQVAQPVEVTFGHTYNKETKVLHLEVTPGHYLSYMLGAAPEAAMQKAAAEWVNVKNDKADVIVELAENEKLALSLKAVHPVTGEEVGTKTATVTPDGVTTGVNEIAVDANGAAVYYNLQGARVANPENGVYIRVINGKASKVVL